ncbi:MAG: AAA family ATPase [Aphanocapsa sp. GSE-SYN-MK-11-07L]|jgi:ribulose bisphosphate carboxylase small subunit|nr:AAA family ATPase [Aphanocapsa sp. GSE-SYN-MK-11-07L]
MSYYISPRFLDKLSVHITKNYLEMPGVKAPLILGVHGRKGEGKSFMCELVYQQMGVQVVHMSAGELESPDAGDSARLVRLRYREAAEMVKVRGRMAVLMINDIDAGAGRMDAYTQYTVNTQLVNGTLMNIADNPTNVQLPGSYELEPIQRIPIIVTGNDFSTLYAPLIRDGRMDKFYWEPDRDDRIGIIGSIFGLDQIAQADIVKLVDAFPEQAIDFFSALRSRLYDQQVRQLIEAVGIGRISMRVVNSTEPPPEFRKPDFSLPHLLEHGQQMVQEQQRVREMRLAEEYNQSWTRNRALGEIARTPLTSESPLELPKAPEVSLNGQQSPQSEVQIREAQPELADPAVTHLIDQSDRIGLEYADQRHFRINSWQSYATVDPQQAIAALESCLRDHPQAYVRLVGISNRRRLVEKMIQRPDKN